MSEFSMIEVGGESFRAAVCAICSTKIYPAEEIAIHMIYHRATSAKIRRWGIKFDGIEREYHERERMQGVPSIRKAVGCVACGPNLHGKV